MASAAKNMIGPSIQRQLVSGLAANQSRRNLTTLRAASSYLYYKPIYRLATAASRATLLPHKSFPLESGHRYLTNSSSNTYAPISASFNKRPIELNDNRDTFELSTSDHLPSLPVPNLSETLERLKETIWPIAMNSQEFAKALHLIEAFSGSPGQKLDLLLRAKANQTKNWLTHDWWLQEAYLKSRRSLVINSNPGLIYPQLPFEVRNQRKLINTCALMISSLIECKMALENSWNPERATSDTSETICYDQYKRIFGSTRIPGKSVDEFKATQLNIDHGSDSFNLICTHRGRFYEIKLENANDQGARIEALESVLSKIIANSNANESDQQSPIGAGVLTTMARDSWASSIRLLDSEFLNSIQAAHLVFNLDTIPNKGRDLFTEPLVAENEFVGNKQKSSEFLGALLRQVLHGDSNNVGNRWFDKSLQLIVVADENCDKLIGAGLNYEHCIGEAIVMTKIIESSYERIVNQQQRQQSLSTASGSSASDCIATFRKLSPAGASENYPEFMEILQQAKQDFQSQINQFDLTYFEYQKYGRDSIKSWRFSPDSWFQVALQLAHHQLHRRLGPCYESASTRRFAYGRTETIRSLTKDVGQFCFEPSFETLQAAASSHKSYAEAATKGQAIDRVLLAYRLIFNELKANQWSWGLPTFASKSSQAPGGSDRVFKFDSLERTQREQQVNLSDLFTEKELNILSAFFNNELFERAKRFSLSTSQVSSLDHPSICTSYGPLVADGYACCYNLSRKQIAASIAANSSNQSFSCETKKFSESLQESLDRMRDIVSESHQHDQHYHKQQQQQNQ